MTAPHDPYPPYWRAYLPFFGLPAEHPPPHAETVRAGGWTLPLDRHGPADAPVSVLLVHGAGGYGRLFAPLAQRLSRHGVEVIAPDLPGYGRHRAHWTQVDYGVWQQALLALIETEYRARPRPIVLLGASIGGFLAWQVAARSPHVHGLVVTTLADPRDAAVQAALVRWSWMRRTLPWLKPPARLTRGLRVPVRWFTHMQHMSRDPALSAVVCSDPQGGGNRVPLGLLASLFDARAPAAEAFDRCPVLMVRPANDRWTPVAISDPLFERLTVPKHRVLLQNCGHFPIEAPGVDQFEAAMLDFLETVRDGSSRAKPLI